MEWLQGAEQDVDVGILAGRPATAPGQDAAAQEGVQRDGPAAGGAGPAGQAEAAA